MKAVTWELHSKKWQI